MYLCQIGRNGLVAEKNNNNLVRMEYGNEGFEQPSFWKHGNILYNSMKSMSKDVKCDHLLTSKMSKTQISPPFFSLNVFQCFDWFCALHLFISHLFHKFSTHNIINCFNWYSKRIFPKFCDIWVTNLLRSSLLYNMLFRLRILLCPILYIKNNNIKREVPIENRYKTLLASIVLLNGTGWRIL